MGDKQTWIQAVFLLCISTACISSASDGPPNPLHDELGRKCVNENILNQLHSSIEALSERASRLLYSVSEPENTPVGQENQISNETLTDFWAQLTQLEIFLEKIASNVTADTQLGWNITENSGLNSSQNPVEQPDHLEQTLQIETLKYGVYNLWKDVRHIKEELSDLIQENSKYFNLENTRMLALAGEISAIQNTLVWLNDNITFVSTWTAKLGARMHNQESDMDELNALVVSLGTTLAEETSRTHLNLTALEHAIDQLSARLEAQSPNTAIYKQQVLQYIRDTKVKVKDNVINPKYNHAVNKGESPGFFSQLFSLGGQDQAALSELHGHEVIGNLSQEISQLSRNLEELQTTHSTFVEEVNSKIAAIETWMTHLQRSEKSHGGQSPITNESCNGLRRHLVGDSCFFVPDLAILDHQFTWWDARYLCKQDNTLGPKADLVAIQTKEKMEDIIRLISNHFGGIEEFWLGASDLEEEGRWVWSLTGEALNQDSYTNWQHVPDRNTEVNCMSMFKGYKWAAEPCFYERYPLCELHL